MELTVKTSSREGDLVADFFMGSDATMKAALKNNRRMPGVEIEKKRFELAKAEILSRSGMACMFNQYWTYL